MEFTDLKELKKLMAGGGVNKFEFEENLDNGSYDKGMILSYGGTGWSDKFANGDYSKGD